MDDVGNDDGGGTESVTIMPDGSTSSTPSNDNITSEGGSTPSAALISIRDQDVYRSALIAGCTGTALAALAYLRRGQFPLVKAVFTPAPATLFDWWWIDRTDTEHLVGGAALTGATAYALFRDRYSAALGAAAWIAAGLMLPYVPESPPKAVVEQQLENFQKEWDASDLGTLGLKYWSGESFPPSKAQFDQLIEYAQEKYGTQAPPNFQQNLSGFVRWKDCMLATRGASDAKLAGLQFVVTWQFSKKGWPYNPNHSSPPFSSIAEIDEYCRTKGFLIYSVNYETGEDSTFYYPYPDFAERRVYSIDFYMLQDAEKFYAMALSNQLLTKIPSREFYVHPSVHDTLMGKGWEPPRYAVIGYWEDFRADKPWLADMQKEERPQF